MRPSTTVCVVADGCVSMTRLPVQVSPVAACAPADRPTLPMTTAVAATAAVTTRDTRFNTAIPLHRHSFPARVTLPLDCPHLDRPFGLSSWHPVGARCHVPRLRVTNGCAESCSLARMREPLYGTFWPEPLAAQRSWGSPSTRRT